MGLITRRSCPGPPSVSTSSETVRIAVVVDGAILLNDPVNLAMRRRGDADGVAAGLELRNSD
jgi:hypothetical protein